MSKIKYVAVIMALGFIAISCGDSDNDAPLVNITAPAAGSTYAVPDTMIITGTVTEDTKLESVVLSSELIDDLSLDPLSSDTLHTFNVNLFLGESTPTGDYTLTVTATDEAGNVGTDEVQVTLQ
ncbi:MAG: Ig-like domain-containing protein [Bacteroidota bacterium]